MGPCRLGMDTRPLARLSPRKSSVPHHGPSGPRRRGRGFTERWLDAARAPSNPWLARWLGRLGHGQSSVAQGGRWRRRTQFWGLLGQPRSWGPEGQGPEGLEIKHLGEVLTSHGLRFFAGSQRPRLNCGCLCSPERSSLPGGRPGFPTGRMSAVHATAAPGRRRTSVCRWPVPVIQGFLI